MKKILLVSVLLGLLAGCSDKTPELPPTPPKAENKAQVGVDEKTGMAVVDPTKGDAVNEADRIGRLIQERYPNMDLVSIKPVGDEKVGLFEIQATQFNGRAAYTDKDLKFFLVGGDLYVSNEKNEMVSLSAPAKNDFFESKLKELPLDWALTYKVGAGERTLLMFSDPDCPKCAAQETFFLKNAERANLTLRILPMPLTRIHPDAADKARAILCSSNPTGNWNRWMTASAEVRADWPKFAKTLDNKDLACEHAQIVDKVVGITQELDLNETPTLLFENGSIYKGLLDDLDALDKAFAFVQDNFAQNPSAPRVIPPALNWKAMAEQNQAKDKK